MMNPRREMNAAPRNDGWLATSMQIMTQAASLSATSFTAGQGSSDAELEPCPVASVLIKVQTDEGQRPMLFLDPASLARLHVGTPCLLQIANESTRDTSRPPEHEGAFW
jgi:hypothetical protein